MLLAIDAGNTNIVFGIYKNEEWIHEWRLDTLPVKSEAEYDMFLRSNFLESGLHLDGLDGIVISSVVPQLNEVLTNFAQSFIEKPVFVGPKVFDQLPVKTKNPYQIGTDLVANAVAGYTLYQTTTIVVDFGTALTMTTVGEDGVIQGASIAPGLKTAIKALVGNTAQLPEVSLDLPDSVLGLNTIHAIQSGVLWGYVSMVEGMLDRLGKELDRPHKIVATGGLSSILHPLHDRFDDVKRHLTLDGLRIIHEIVSNAKV